MKFDYATVRSIGTLPTLLNYLKSDLWLSTLAIFLLLKLIYLIDKKQLPNLLWEPLAIGACFYFFAYVRLQMFEKYFILSFP